MGLKVNDEVTIDKMDVVKNGGGGLKALPEGGLGPKSRVFACTDEEKSLGPLVSSVLIRVIFRFLIRGTGKKMRVFFFCSS